MTICATHLLSHLHLRGWEMSISQVAVIVVVLCKLSGNCRSGPSVRVPIHLENLENSWKFMFDLEFLE